eukprot:TRINITY_DN186_c0_g1_i8.p2 TRINITY_DN186_c0_g1~~TRINITY_DN186_c0_g1_i8.p2  ORF type:complete len:142 (-),score=14.36 TRINITY_DN186_c0_g1_i8:142-567(-)
MSKVDKNKIATCLYNMQDEDIFGQKFEDLFKQLRQITQELYPEVKDKKFNREFCEDLYRTTRNAFYDKLWMNTQQELMSQIGGQMLTSMLFQQESVSVPQQLGSMVAQYVLSERQKAKKLQPNKKQVFPSTISIPDDLDDW